MGAGYWETMIDCGYAEPEADEEMVEAPVDVCMSNATRPTNPHVVVEIDGSSTGSTEGQGDVPAGVIIIDVDKPSKGQTSKTGAFTYKN